MKQQPIFATQNEVKSGGKKVKLLTAQNLYPGAKNSEKRLPKPSQHVNTGTYCPPNSSIISVIAA